MARKISRSIHDKLPTAEDVREASMNYEARYWIHEGYPNLRSGIIALGLREGQAVTRADVFGLVESNPVNAVMLAMVWGFPEGTINGKRPPLEAIFREAEHISDRLKELRHLEPLPARDLIDELNELCGEGASTSTTSKLAYFFGLTTREGACLIYDYKVVGAIMEGTFREFLVLRRTLPTKPKRGSRDLTARLKSAQGRHTATYGDYLGAVHNVAARLTKQTGVPVKGDRIELGLYKGAPESSDQSARTRRWKKKKQIKLRTLSKVA